jgi:hypothetical protein
MKMIIRARRCGSPRIGASIDETEIQDCQKGMPGTAAADFRLICRVWWWGRFGHASLHVVLDRSGAVQRFVAAIASTTTTTSPD